MDIEKDSTQGEIEKVMEISKFPPPRISGTIEATLEYGGHTKPLPEPDVDFIEDDFPRPVRPSTLIPITLEYAGKSKPRPDPLADDDLIDRDAGIDIAPIRPSGTIQVTLEYAGHSKPMLPDDPKDYE